MLDANALLGGKGLKCILGGDGLDGGIIDLEMDVSQARVVVHKDGRAPRSNFEAKRLSEMQLGREVQKMCTGRLGLELRVYFFNLPLSYAFGDPSPTPLVVGKDAPGWVWGF